MGSYTREHSLLITHHGTLRAGQALLRPVPPDITCVTALSQIYLD